jgi:predicted DNA-binding transcriptional regulator AlpA
MSDPVGTVEIAARLGVSRSAVDAWRHRHPDFPEPRWTVGGRPAWDWSDVEAWARSTGRT